LAGLFFLIAVGAIAPFITARRFSGAIRDGLERSLGRKVVFDSAHFDLFSGPGFSLEGVTISEDARYGIEPFAYVPTLQARLRIDKLLAGKIQFSSLRLVNPSLNLVKNGDGEWNVVTLMRRVSPTQKTPLNLFPFIEVSQGRVDFKIGARKTTLYILDSDLSIYPEKDGKVYVSFSGSPARTDRAGMGFGHFRGGINWFASESEQTPGRVQAEIDLEPSNLSELTTLVQGHDLGIHGTVSSKLQFEGPASGLTVAGEVHLNDVHRWDLLPSSGEAWAVKLGGNLDLLKQHLELRTAPGDQNKPAPIAVRVMANAFLSHPRASVAVDFKDTPLVDLLPLAKRMGMPIANEAKLAGTLNGAVSYSNSDGWMGGFVINNAEATLEDAPTLRSASVNITTLGDRLRFGPAIIDAETGGTMRMSGSFSLPNRATKTSIVSTNVSIKALKQLASKWFETPAALAALNSGNLTGEIAYASDPENLDLDGGVWSGQFDFSEGSLSVPGLAAPIQAAQGHVSFNPSSFELDRLNGQLGERRLRARYRYNLRAKHTEQLRIEFPAVDLAELENALTPPANSDSLWSRLRLFRRSFPSWLSGRNLEGDLKVDHLLVDQNSIGALEAKFLWLGTHLDVNNVSLQLQQGSASATGTVELASFVPKWHFSAKATDFPWAGGLLNAEGEVSSTGAGQDLLKNLIAEGSFDGRSIALSAGDTFQSSSGKFEISFGDGWPDLRLSEVQAMQDGEEWTGAGNTESSGRLILDLSHEGKQLHFVSSLSGEPQATPSTGTPQAASPASFFGKLEF
jgi:hypothetical protein